MSDNQTTVLIGDNALPCPFCGEQPKITKHFREEIWRLTHHCRVIGPITINWRETIPSLLKDWNRRV